MRNIIGFALLGLILASCKDPEETLPTPLPVPPQVQVWFAPNIGAPDTIQMFQSPELWSQSRNRMQVFQLYVQNIIYDQAGTLPLGCPSCGANVFPNLVAVGAFQKLATSGIQFALESGAVKPGSIDTCAGTGYALSNRRVFQRLAANSARPGLMIMDQPLNGGDACPNMNLDAIVESSFRFMKLTQSYYEEIYGPGAQLPIGLTEPYPAESVERIQQFIDGVLAQGGKIPFFHLDVDRNHVADLNIKEAQFSKDLHALYSFCNSRGIAFGIIYTGFDNKTDTSYRDEVLKWLDRSKKVLGVPEHLKFQSFAFVSKNSDGTENWTVPRNLAEGDLTSHTGILIEGLKRLGVW